MLNEKETNILNKVTSKNSLGRLKSEILGLTMGFIIVTALQFVDFLPKPRLILPTLNSIVFLIYIAYILYLSIQLSTLKSICAKLKKELDSHNK